MIERQVDQHGYEILEAEDPESGAREDRAPESDELLRLLRSREIRSVYAGIVAPEKLDRDVEDLRRDCKKWKHLWQLEKASNVELRRKIETMIEAVEKAGRG